jgi:hypothetical protein
MTKTFPFLAIPAKIYSATIFIPMEIRFGVSRNAHLGFFPFANFSIFLPA